MKQRYLLWDQDHFMLRGNLDSPDTFVVNPTAREPLESLRDTGYTNLTFSNKSAQSSRKKAQIVGLEGLFEEFFDSRKRSIE